MASEKIMIPQSEHPAVNFIGRLLGPRGTTFRAMATKTGAKIVIRGKGSFKEGQRSSREEDHLHEPLHGLVTAKSSQKIDAAKRMIQRVLRQAINGEDESKVKQLRELAISNGTFRNDEVRNTSLSWSSSVVPPSNTSTTDTSNKASDVNFDEEYRKLLSDINGESL